MPETPSRAADAAGPSGRWFGSSGGAALGLVLVAVLAGCATGPPRWPASGSDGAEAHPPADLAQVPDAQPRLEPIRPGGPNKPYDVLGRSYVPITRDAPYTERGLASWYGRKFQGRRTASGEIYNMYAMTAAHPTLPIPSYARVRNPANGREVVVRINDRGPFHPGRIIDLSYTAALKLDLLRGVAPVEVQRITFDDIRSGAWQREGGQGVVRVASNNVDASGATPMPRPSPSPAAVAAALDGPTPAPAVPDATPISPPSTTPVPSSTPAPGRSSSADAATETVAASRAPRVLPGSAIAEVATAAPPVAVADAPTARAYTQPARGFWVQLGAFHLRDGAERFQQRVGAELDWLSPLLAVFNDASLFRLQAGPYPTHAEARRVAERVRDGLKLVPTIVERR
ncbi:MAG: septal ring lytic transglycosylase RlpA family protein [Burkholderiales bacterium]|nr:septal ring lytic transglycosylase RlpA family protein [Burkholderiales bacterium]